jgi:hypothetical protein
MELNRRLLLWGAAAIAIKPAAAAKEQAAYLLQTKDADVELTIEFHDRYASRGFLLSEHASKRQFCLSASGEEGRNCMSNFRGSLAIAQYRVRPRSRDHKALALREHVRTVDQDARLGGRPPFERAIRLDKGVGSDLQAFGYEAAPDEKPISELHGPWYLYRQDLYLEPQPAPFLVLYWKHALSSIRVLDLIPGDQTWVVKK